MCPRVGQREGGGEGERRARASGAKGHPPCPPAENWPCARARAHGERSTAHHFSSPPLLLQQLIDALDWCLALGTSTVSVFAFSVDNFRRPAAEVAALMDLAADRLGRLASPASEAGALLARHGVRVRVLGDAGTHLSPLQSLKQGFSYIWGSPDMRATMMLAFLVNFAAYPLVGSLLAYVAKNVYGLDQTGLGWLVASFASGALLGSILVSMNGARIQPARTMIAGALVWFALNLAFSWIRSPGWGEALLFAAGLTQSFCMVPMAVLLLRGAAPALRGRVMGVRMLAVYGLPLGLLLSGPLVEHAGFAATGSLYSLLGFGFTLLIAVRWRAHLWHSAAAANVR